MQPEEYRKMAAVEDRMWYYRALHARVAEALADLPEGAAILDAGCGTGGLLRKLERRNRAWQLSGLDFSPLACALARERTGATIVEGSVLRLPFAAEAFHAVSSCDVLCQVESPETALREFARCLRPGGRIVLTMPAYAWMYSYHDREVGNLRRYSRGEVQTLFRAAGLRAVYATYWNSLAFPLAIARRKLFPPSSGASDVNLSPAPVEAVFGAMTSLENLWLRAGGRFPCGNSVLAVAVKAGA